MVEPALPDLLRRRLDLVTRLSLSTSEMQKCRQQQMAAELDAQRCEMNQNDAAQDLQRELHEALCRVEEAESGVNRCEALIAEIEQSLAETDREIEAWRGADLRR